MLLHDSNKLRCSSKLPLRSSVLCRCAQSKIASNPNRWHLYKYEPDPLFPLHGVQQTWKWTRGILWRAASKHCKSLRSHFVCTVQLGLCCKYGIIDCSFATGLKCTGKLQQRVSLDTNIPFPLSPYTVLIPHRSIKIHSQLWKLWGTIVWGAQGKMIAGHGAGQLMYLSDHPSFVSSLLLKVIKFKFICHFKNVEKAKANQLWGGGRGCPPDSLPPLLLTSFLNWGNTTEVSQAVLVLNQRKL